jgi:hypothetical protein
LDQTLVAVVVLVVTGLAPELPVAERAQNLRSAHQRELHTQSPLELVEQLKAPTLPVTMVQTRSLQLLLLTEAGRDSADLLLPHLVLEVRVAVEEKARRVRLLVEQERLIKVLQVGQLLQAD